MNKQTPESRDITYTTLSVLIIGILIASCFWILRPFLMSLAWASIIVVATWPILERLQARLTHSRGLAVTLMALAMLLIVIFPVMAAALTIVDNAEGITVQVRSVMSHPLSAPPEWVQHIPLVGEKFAERWKEFASFNAEQRADMVSPYARTLLQWFVAQAGSIGMAVVQFLLTVIIATILYSQGEIVQKGVLNFARRLAGQQGEAVAVLAAKAVRGVVLGVVLTALIQTAIGGVGLFVTGVPAAGLLSAVTLMLCLAQLGPMLVMVPAVVWLYWSEHPFAGTVLLVFAIVAGTIDNFIRPVLIRRGADLPLLLIFAGVIGGLIGFGIIGLFIGPVVLAVTYTLVKAWVAGSTQDEDAAGSGNE
jgi:predicted PurR-regulated permease PerM